MITDKEVLAAFNTLTDDMSALSDEQCDAIMVLVQHHKHQAIRKVREQQGLGYLNREEDVIQGIKLSS
jgi:hypothetical protein